MRRIPTRQDAFWLTVCAAVGVELYGVRDDKRREPELPSWTLSAFIRRLFYTHTWQGRLAFRVLLVLLARRLRRHICS